MEDYARYLAEEAESSVVALHQFRILWNPNSEAFHFFFEGDEDILFYMPEARRRLGQRQANIYVCGGKKNVIEVRDAISAEGHELRFCLFFVDRDFDDYLDTQVDSDIYTYMTDHYSIENAVSSLDGARIILEDVIKMSKADPEFSIIETDLSTAFEDFYREIRPLIAWILAAKEAGCTPNLKNTNGLKGIVHFDGMRPELTRAGFASFKRKVVVNGLEPNFSAILRWRRRLDLRSCKFWVRGKYDIWFFREALLKALDRANGRRKQVGGKAIKVPTSLREGRVFEILGGRITLPESLTNFLTDRLQ